MEQATHIDRGVTAFFAWLTTFEAKVPTLGGAAQHYADEHLETLVRYSWFKASTAGLPAICMAATNLRGTRESLVLLQRVARRFAREPHDLQAQVLYLEQPTDRRLCLWLADRGFAFCQPCGEA